MPDQILFGLSHHFAKQLVVDLGTRIISPIRMDDVNNLEPASLVVFIHDLDNFAVTRHPCQCEQSAESRRSINADRIQLIGRHRALLYEINAGHAILPTTANINSCDDARTYVIIKYRLIFRSNI